MSRHIRSLYLASIVEQRRLQEACANVKTHQSLCCSHTHDIDVDKESCSTENLSKEVKEGVCAYTISTKSQRTSFVYEAV